MAIEYRVTEEAKHIGEGLDPDDWEKIPAWKVTRVEDRFGWRIATYADKTTAEAVAFVLTAAQEREI